MKNKIKKSFNGRVFVFVFTNGWRHRHCTICREMIRHSDMILAMFTDVTNIVPFTY